MSDIFNSLKEIALLAHGHKHFPTLQKLSINSEGKLTFEDNEIKGSEITLPTINTLLDGVTVEDVTDVDSLFILDSVDGKIKKINKNLLVVSMADPAVIPKAVIFCGASDNTKYTKIIDSFLFATATNSHLFGNATYQRSGATAYANSKIAIMTGGSGELSGTAHATLTNKEKITFITEANSVLNSAYLTTSSKSSPVSFSYELCGIYACGDSQGASEKQVFSTEAISVYYSYTASKAACAFSTPIKGWIAGGFVSSVASAAGIGIVFANATSYNNFSSLLTAARTGLTACSNKIRGIFMGGISNTSVQLKTLEYVTVASMAKAVAWGATLTLTTANASAVSDETKGVIVGGQNEAVFTNTMEYVNFTTTATKADFGDLTVARRNTASASNCHGGLQF